MSASPLVGSAASDPGVSSWVWVAAVRGGDREAFGWLYERYVDVVFRVVRSRVGERCLAEDLTSETFLRALRGIESLSDQGRDVGAWLVTIAVNLVRDHYRSRRYQRERPSSVPVEDPNVWYPWGPVVGACGPEDAAVAAAEVEELARAVAGLSPVRRECLRLRFFAGLSVGETAAVMGRSEGAVKALQHRAVRALARSLPEWVAR